jgi:large subunit ribosomal protein L10
LPCGLQAKTFIFKLKGGEKTLAFTKQQKTEMVAQYEQWLSQSQALFLLEYSKMSMKAIDGVRTKVRDSGGEIHVVKNTLFAIALKNKGIPQPKGMLDGSTIVGFAFSDPPALAKTVQEFTKNSEVFKVKAGYLGTQPISTAEIKALADLPPLPVMRARVLGMLQAPAGKLVRTLAEPARSLAAVFKSYSEKDSTPTPVAG